MEDLYQEALELCETWARGYIRLICKNRERYNRDWKHACGDEERGRGCYIECLTRMIIDHLVEDKRFGEALRSKDGFITPEAEGLANHIYEMLHNGIPSDRRGKHAEVSKERTAEANG